jgi:phage tail sheath gpL-like
MSTDSDGATLDLGPTDAGMVRIVVASDRGAEIALDFDPDEADEIADELRAAAAAARELSLRPKPRKR